MWQKKYDAKITLVVCLGDYSTGTWYMDNRIADIEFKKQYKTAQQRFEKLILVADKAGVSFSSKILRTKHIVKTLVNYAKTRKMDLVVLGSHGKTNWDKLLLGSVANGLAQKDQLSCFNSQMTLMVYAQIIIHEITCSA